VAMRQQEELAVEGGVAGWVGRIHLQQKACVEQLMLAGQGLRVEPGGQAPELGGKFVPL
jgi:hypothetical protein